MRQFKLTNKFDRFFMAPAHYNVDEITQDDLCFDYDIRCISDTDEECLFLADEEGLEYTV